MAGGRPRKRAERRPKGPPRPLRSRTQRERAVALHLAGLTGRSIAGHLGVHEDTVSDWFQEPWVRELVAAGRKETVDAIVSQAHELARAETLSSLRVLVELRDDPAVQDSTRRLAAEAILDRGGVEAKQVLEHGGKIEGGAGSMDLSRLSTAELLAWRELRLKAQGG